MSKEKIAFVKAHEGQHIEGNISGLGAWLNARILSVNEKTGMLQLEFEVRPDMLNPMGSLHGGAISAILDESMGMQLFVLSEDRAYYATSLQLDFVRAAFEGQKVVAQPELIRIGKRSANMRCLLLDQEGKVLAHGSSNYLQIPSS